jgi:hypothetical protein
MVPHRDTQYFFQVERLLLEQQLKASLQRTTALRARAQRQKDFPGQELALQVERILLHSQRRLNELKQGELKQGELKEQLIPVSKRHNPRRS